MGPNRGAVVDADKIPAWLKPTRLHENPYYIFSGALTRDEVHQYLDKTLYTGEIDPVLAGKVATYCVDFAKHCVLANILCGGPEPRGAVLDAKRYEAEMRPLIEKVDRMAARAKTKQNVSDIINELMRVALDPL